MRISSSRTIGTRREGTRGNSIRQREHHRGAERVHRVITHMLQHVNRRLRVPTLSAVAGVSPSYLFSLFKSVTGRAPVEFFICLRMQRARALLISSNLTIKEIAAALGYDDPLYFSRRFKGVIGVAPRKYRTRMLVENPRTIPRRRTRWPSA